MHRLGPEGRLNDCPVATTPGGAAADPHRPGVCRVCGCTDSTPCVEENGMTCVWVDANHTLCDHLECIAQVPMSELEQMLSNLEAT